MDISGRVVAAGTVVLVVLTYLLLAGAEGWTPFTPHSDSPPHASASGSPLSTGSSSAGPSSTATGPGGASSGHTEYSTPEPFPLCDPNGAEWNLVNLTPQASGGCANDLTVAVTNNNGWGFGTTSNFPNGTRLTASNAVTLTASLPGTGGYQNWCAGVVEGSAATGYLADICNGGKWSIMSATGLGSHGVIVGKELASGSFPFTGGTSYDVALAFKHGSATLTISVAQGSGSPLQQSITTADFTPTAVGYAFANSDPTLPINPSYPAVGGFIYHAD